MSCQLNETLPLLRAVSPVLYLADVGHPVLLGERWPQVESFFTTYREDSLRNQRRTSSSTLDLSLARTRTMPRAGSGSISSLSTVSSLDYVQVLALEHDPLVVEYPLRALQLLVSTQDPGLLLANRPVQVDPRAGDDDFEG